MVYPFTYPENALAGSLFAPLIKHNLVLESILNGQTPAVIYANDPLHPGAAFTWFKHRAFLAGDPHSPAFISDLANFLDQHLIPAAKRLGIDACILDFNEPEWKNELPKLFPGLEPIHAQRQCYTCHHLPPIVKPILPDGFSLLPVDAAMLSRMDLQHIVDLREETCSERVSVEDFLAHSFGYCITHQDEIVCWCLSEYNTDGKCEVGVATVEQFQRRGLATIATLALLEHAFRSGYTQVGWHCWSRNQPSGALALKTGFTLEHEHTVYLYTSLTME